MPWVRIDEHALNHVKVLALSNGAFRLWVEGLAHCQKHLTDGAITAAALKTFRYATAARVSEMRTSGLWDGGASGEYVVHDYLIWNDSREKITRERELSKRRFERMKKRRSNGVATVPHYHNHSDPKDQDHTVPREAFAGKVLRIPKFLDAEFVARLNGQYFNLTAFYMALDTRLAQTGEPWDLRWIRDQFAAEAPQPARVNHAKRAQAAPVVSPEHLAAMEARAVERAAAEQSAESLASEVLGLWPESDRQALRDDVCRNLTNCFPNIRLTEVMVTRSMVQEVIDRYKGRLPEAVAALREQGV